MHELKECDQCNENIPLDSYPFVARYLTYWCERCGESFRDELLEWDRRRESFYELKDKKEKQKATNDSK